MSKGFTPGSMDLGGGIHGIEDTRDGITPEVKKTWRKLQGIAEDQWGTPS